MTKGEVFECQASGLSTFVCLQLSLSKAFSKGSAVTCPFFMHSRQLQGNFLLCEISFIVQVEHFWAGTCFLLGCFHRPFLQWSVIRPALSNLIYLSLYAMLIPTVPEFSNRLHLLPFLSNESHFFSQEKPGTAIR